MRFLETIFFGRPASSKMPIAPVMGALCVLSVLMLSHASCWVFIAGFLGLLFCASLRMTGFFYALILLAIFSIPEHLFSSLSHTTLIGIELSCALSFLVTSLSFDHLQSEKESFLSQIEIQNRSCANIEEERAKLQETLTESLVQAQIKIDGLQARIDELSSDYDSVLILNEVLRKTTHREICARESKEKELEKLLQENKEITAKLLDSPEDSSLLLENAQYRNQIDALSIEKEQVRMVNETLSRLHLKEKTKAEEALKKIEELEQEIVKIRQEQLKPLSHIEAMHKQLKEQFAEKHTLLEQTRKELFHADNRLQALEIEKRERSLTPFPKEILKELALLEKKSEGLQEENTELHEIISSLMQSQPNPKERESETDSSDSLGLHSQKRKKKAKLNPDQTQFLLSEDFSS